MANPFPKILTRLTVPSGGWTFKWYASNAAQFDTAITATIPAGDYYVSGDNQSDDFLWSFMLVAIAASKAAGFNEGPILFNKENTASERFEQKYIVIGFEGASYTGATGQDVRIAWTEEDGGDIGAVLGFDTSADLDLTGSDNPVSVADYQHGYGFYCTDREGQLGDDLAEDTPIARAIQNRAISGHTKTQLHGTVYDNRISLRFLTRADTYSNGVEYGEASVMSGAGNPVAYERNRALECWWHAVKDGTPFRVYRDGRIDTDHAAERGDTATAGTITTLNDASKSWVTEPQRYAGRMIYSTEYYDELTGYPARWHIASNTSSSLVASGGHPLLYNFRAESNPMAYYIFDVPYRTYVVDLRSMQRFEPRELPNIDHYDIDIPLLRYVSG